jgi:hypothetical protein
MHLSEGVLAERLGMAAVDCPMSEHWDSVVALLGTDIRLGEHRRSHHRPKLVPFQCYEVAVFWSA